VTPVLALAVGLALAVSSCAQVLTDQRLSRRFASRSLLALGVFAVHGAAGWLVFFHLLHPRPEAALGVTAGFLGWLGLGTLVLMRVVPRTREPPRFLMRVGVLDLMFLGLILFGVASAAGLTQGR
jgi:hypothetical protein